MPKSSKTSNRKSEQTKTRILDAALQVFAQQGLSGARIDAIATRSQSNKERIYAYFGNKEKLFTACIAASFETLLASEEKLLELGEADIPELTSKLLQHYFQFHQDHPLFWRMLNWCNLEQRDTPLELDQIRSNTYQHLQNLYTLGQNKGLLNPQVSFQVYFFHLSAISFFYLSNRSTMSSTLKLDLKEDSVRSDFIQQCTLLLDHGLKHP